MPDLETHTLDLPGRTLTYDIAGELRDAGPHHPALLLAGSPMDASGFTTLATYFTDRPVVTYDPRGVGRSVRTDHARDLSPDDHADDLRDLITALDCGAVDLFGSSGGAINALVLAARRPGHVRTLVAHEPPAVQVLPDREQLLAANHDIHQTYQRRGMGPAMAKFISLTSRAGPLPESYADEPDPDPAAFGLSSEDDGSRDDPLLGKSMLTVPGYELDFDALAVSPSRIVIAAGQESEGQMTARAAAAIAERLGLELAVFPSHHAGFTGGEFGMHGDPGGFAKALRGALEVG